MGAGNEAGSTLSDVNRRSPADFDVWTSGAHAAGCCVLAMLLAAYPEGPSDQTLHSVRLL
jgi:hypothetical protein